MADDFLTRARETAEREAEKAAPDKPIKIIGDYQENIFREIARDGFKAGFTTAVSRLPSEEEIARVIAMTDDYDGCFERIEAWEAASIQERECGEVEEPLSSDQEDCQFWLRRARAVRELIETRLLANTNRKGNTQ